jgi:hypothetical protein
MGDDKQYVKLTVRLPEDLHRDLKTICFVSDESINKTVEGLVRDYVNANKDKARSLK